MATEKTPAAQAADGEKALPETEEELDADDSDKGAGPDEDEEGDDEAGESEEGEPPADGPDEERPSKSKLKRERTKARIVELERATTEATARADAAERSLKALSDELGPAPKKENYQDPDEYIADLAAYRADERALARQKKAQTSTTESARQDAGSSRMNLFRERAMALAERYPDIEAKVLTDPTLPISQGMAEAIMESERGPEVAYYLASHREEASRIKAMPPLAAARELGRIEALLSAPKPKTLTRAPKPVPTISGAAPTRAAKYPGDMNPKEYARYRANGGGA